jgi:DNA-binding HxlR family transcriptional regulator
VRGNTFNEIQRVVEGFSARVLSSALKEMELKGLVKRIVHTQTPAVVEYQITDYADTLVDVLLALRIGVPCTAIRSGRKDEKPY